jgi:U3 small nucleolar RNA-associated protein 13
MASTRQPHKTTFEAARVIRPIYTGGPVSLTDDARVLATALGDHVVLTDPATGRHLARVEGDGESVTSLICGW